MRSWGLIRQIALRHPVTLVVFVRTKLTQELQAQLLEVVHEVIEVPLLDTTARGRADVLRLMTTRKLPYHPAAIISALQGQHETARLIRNWPSVVTTSGGHFGVLVLQSGTGRNWILNQADADIQFWEAYASQVKGPLRKAAATANWWLAKQFFPRVYPLVGAITSVSQEDKDLTTPLSTPVEVYVIPNGVDVGPMMRRSKSEHSSNLIFAGTSAPRNVAALRDFVDYALPRIRLARPDTSLSVVGNFGSEAQKAFADVPNIHFTGMVESMDPYYANAGICVIPYSHAHGSKLKVAEAMEKGVPVVSTVAGVRGFAITSGKEALIARDFDEFADMVVALFENPEKQLELISNARHYVETNLAWDVVGKAFEAVIQIVQDNLDNDITH